MTKPIRISPSQWGLFKLCQRKAMFAYGQGLREPGTRATTLGTRVHQIHEDYNLHSIVPELEETWTFSQYLHGELNPKSPQLAGNDKGIAEAERIIKHDPNALNDHKVFYPGRIALSMMPKGLYPAPGIGKVEDRFEWENEGIVWNGLIDWHEYDENGVMGFETYSGAAKRGLIVIMDHKTSSDPIKWGKLSDTDDGPDERKLGNDPQAIIYARAMLGRYGSANVELNWNYGCTDAKPNKARVATSRMVPGTVYAKFENDIMPFARKIRDWRLANVDPLSLAPNPQACFAFHKQCPHAKTCNLSNKERLSTIMAGNAILDSLLAETGNAPATPPTAPPVTAGDQVNPPEAAMAVETTTLRGAPVAAGDLLVPDNNIPVGPSAGGSVGGNNIPLGASSGPEAGKHPPKPKPKPRPKPAKAAADTGTDERHTRVLKRLAELEASDPKLADIVREKVAADLAGWVLSA